MPHIEIDQADYERMRDEIEQLRKERTQAAEDWCNDDDEIRKHALRVLPEDVVNGDTFSVPRFGALAELMADKHESTIRTMHKIAEESERRLNTIKDLRARNEILDGIRIANNEKLENMFNLIRELYDPTPCRLDHHGYCQEHFYFDNSPCPHKQAQELFQ